MLTAVQWAFTIFHTEQDQQEEIEVQKSLINYQMVLHLWLQHKPANMIHLIKGEPLEDTPDDVPEELESLAADPYFGIEENSIPLPPFLTGQGPAPFGFGQGPAPFGFGQPPETSGSSPFPAFPFPVGN
jgi:hypothetical protein